MIANSHRRVICMCWLIHIVIGIFDVVFLRVDRHECILSKKRLYLLEIREGLI